MTNNEMKPRRDSLAACDEAPVCGRLIPACIQINTASVDAKLKRSRAYADRARAEAWVDRNPASWWLIKAAAAAAASQGLHFSLDRLTRRLRGFSVCNNRTAALTRLLVEECPEIRDCVSIAPSSCDAAFDWVDGDEYDRP